jgi:hypothetical protein
LRLSVFAALEAAFESAERQMDVPDFEPDARLHRRIIDYLCGLHLQGWVRRPILGGLTALEQEGLAKREVISKPQA